MVFKISGEKTAALILALLLASGFAAVPPEAQAQDTAHEQAPHQTQAQAQDTAQAQAQHPPTVKMQGPVQTTAHEQLLGPVRESSVHKDAGPGSKSLPREQVSAYLLTMRLITQRYLHIMLSLVAGNGDPIDDPKNAEASPEEIQALGLELARIKPPPELASQHAELAKALSPVEAFVREGGAAQQGFHRALGLAQLMQGISGQYHDAVLAMIKAHGLSTMHDPFIVERSLPEKVAGKASNRSPGSSRFGAILGNGAGAKLLSPDRSSMINGVDGAQGMSGLFNGLSGNSSNGLVGGLGFSSGQNGLLNGAGVSSGMSGMLNDTDSTGSANSDGKY